MALDDYDELCAWAKRWHLEDEWCLAHARSTSRFWGNYPQARRHYWIDRDDLKGRIGQDLDAAAASEAGLVTFTPDDIDWEDEIRLCLEERASFSPDALTGLEANYRFVGPETIETKIFGRLTAWQNWIFQRPNATGEKGALKCYGRPERPSFDWRRT